MASIEIDEVLAKRFRIDRPPTLLARKSRPARLAFSRMRSAHPVRGRSLAVPAEAAYSFHVPLAAPFFSNLWMAGKPKPLPKANLGDAFLFDLSENPTVGLDTQFDSLRFYVPQAALDDMASETGLPRIKGLHARHFGSQDPVMYGLAQALAGAIADPSHDTALFCDHVAVAFFAHILDAYAGCPIKEHARGSLAPWQLRRACEFIDDNLDADPTIFEIAQQCGLSSSYFSRAFKRATDLPPHRWIKKRRVERAKQLLLEQQATLAEIAQMCGFSDQSHFARVFTASEGRSPGRWRRLRCR